MYVPLDFRVDDQSTLHDLMERFSFSTLITVQDGRPLVTHLPFLLDRQAGEHGTLIGHMARANQQWQSFSPGIEALAIFQGDHGYVSPSWYEVHPAVPTWNYLVVHAYGAPRIIEDEDGKRAVLGSLVAKFESGSNPPWTMELPDAYLRAMMQGIAAFEMPISRLEGKFKLSQNRSREDQARVVAALAQSPHSADRALASAMAQALGLTPDETL
jgi:transcriptional regulator